MLSLEELVLGCQKDERKAQKELYDKYAPLLLGICIRYAKDSSEAEDVLQEGFIKIFDKIKSYNNDGSFEGWMRRLMVNTAISNYRKNLKRYYKVDIDEPFVKGISQDWTKCDYTKGELLGVISTLPEGYKMVFNLYAIEGYKHKEISGILGISENTSKSQLSKARKYLKNEMEKLEKIKSLQY